MWLALSDAVSVADVGLGALAGLAAVLALSRLQTPSPHPYRPWIALRLVGIVLADIARSNMAVASIVLRRKLRGVTSGFIEVPLEVRHPAALAGLACIITATPGTAWAGYDSASGTLTMHVLDLVDETALVRTIKARYERPLMEIFE
jgi:multicomponent K+:H+ antiporter subunit E